MHNIIVCSPSCSLCACRRAQTNKHVLLNCGSPMALHWYTIRQNDVVRLLISWLWSVVPSTNSMYVDSSADSALPVFDLFHNYRPDVALVMDREIHTWELTICNETNILKSCAHKQNRYIQIDSAETALSTSRNSHTHNWSVDFGFVSNVLTSLNQFHIPSLTINLKQQSLNLFYRIHLTFIVTGTTLPI